MNLSNPRTQHECTKYVINQVLSKFGESWGNSPKADKALVSGDAWTIGSHLLSGGGTRKFDIYTSFNQQERQNPVQSVKNRWSRGWRPDVSQLRIGDVVGIFYEPSPHHQALVSGTGVAQGYQGTDLNTHTGVIVGYDSQGHPIVSHNVHGIVYNEPLIQGTIYGGKPSNWGNRPTGFIVSAYTPKYN